MRFFLTGIGKDLFILGYPFLFAFNPQINWKKGHILGLVTKISTIEFKQAHRLLRKIQLRAIRACGGWHKKGEAIYYRRATTLQDMTHRWQRKLGKTAPEKLSDEYR